MKKRIAAMCTALALCVSLLPPVTLAAEVEDTGLCPHHLEHTDECGYIAPTGGQPCSHEHTAECYTLGVQPGEDDAYTVSEDTGNLLDCKHDHNEICGCVPADPGQPCTYDCRICPVQALIGALQDAGDITAENVPDVEARLAAIDEARAELTDEELDELNFTKYNAAITALDTLAGHTPRMPCIGRWKMKSFTALAAAPWSRKVRPAAPRPRRC